MKKVFIVCSSLLLLSSSAVLADDYRYELVPYIGQNFSDDDSGLKDATLGGLRLNSYLNKKLGLQFGYERLMGSEFKYPRYSNSPKETDINRYYMNAILRGEKEYGITPYLIAGFGYEDIDKECACECSQWFTNAGVGANVEINKNLDVVPEVKFIRKADNADVDIVGSLGLGYKFGYMGEVREEVAAAPVAVIPVPVVEAPVPVIREESVVIPDNAVILPPEPAREECTYAKAVPAKNRCDSKNYIQVAALLRCLPNEQFSDKKFLNKIKRAGYKYKIINMVNKNGQKVSRVLVGPYKCTNDARKRLCDVKRKIAPDAYVYRTRK